MKKQSGFTLIELVVVIVILGILAVTAAPKFLNLQDDAKINAVKGLAGAMRSAIGITYGKAAVSEQESLESGSILVDGVSASVKFGYPLATSASLTTFVDGVDNDWTINPTNTGTTHVGGIAFGYDDLSCVVIYKEAISANQPATVEVKGNADNCVADDE